jgi:MFS family permease
MLSLLTMFFSAAVSLTIYIDSSFLTEKITQSPALADIPFWNDANHVVGVLYTFSSLVTILFLLYAPPLLRRFGNYRWTLGMLIIHALLLLGLAGSESAVLAVLLFIVDSALISVLWFNLDVFLERYSKNENTGAIRGLFTALSSLAWLFPPMIAGIIAEKRGFGDVYFMGAVLIVPVIIFLMRYFSDFKDLSYEKEPSITLRKHVLGNPNIRNILIISFFLHCFYAWMVIYAPLYLHDKLGFSLAEIGIMLTIALSAFIIFPYPTGRIADKWIGEKELLGAGLVLAAGASLAIPFLASHTATIFGWALVLFVGRSGAATAETMIETYFFKQIDGREVGAISYFRRMRPIAFIVAPLAASALLEFEIIKIEQLFFVLAGLMIIALHFVLLLKDTK